MSQFAKDNFVFFEFHPRLCLVKSQETNKILLQGLVGSDELYSFHNLQLQGNPSRLMSTSAFVPNAEFSISTAIVNNTSNVVSNFVVNHSNSANLWHARLGDPNDHVMKIVLKRCNISLLNKNITKFCSSCCMDKAHRLPNTYSQLYFYLFTFGTNFH